MPAHSYQERLTDMRVIESTRPVKVRSLVTAACVRCGADVGAVAHVPTGCLGRALNIRVRCADCQAEWCERFPALARKQAA